jgi:hypothetical protein
MNRFTMISMNVFYFLMDTNDCRLIIKHNIMSKDMITKTMKILITLSASAILLGAIFRLQHWPHGLIILNYGMIAYFLLSIVELRRLRKIISKFEDKDDE